MVAMQILGQALRRMIAVVLYTVIRGRRLILATVAIAFVGWIALLNVNRLPIPAGTLPSIIPGSSQSTPARNVGGARTTARAGTISADGVPSVDSYIKGLTQFDARLMWSALSDDAITGMETRGGSLEALQSGLDEAKRRGARYEDITMIGHYPLSDGRQYLFYVLSRRGFSGPDQLEQVYFVFTVNRDGKISRIE